MKFKCIICEGEVIILSDLNSTKIVECLDCGFSNQEKKKQKVEPEIYVIKRR